MQAEAGQVGWRAHTLGCAVLDHGDDLHSSRKRAFLARPLGRVRRGSLGGCIKRLFEGLEQWGCLPHQLLKLADLEEPSASVPGAPVHDGFCRARGRAAVEGGCMCQSTGAKAAGKPAANARRMAAGGPGKTAHTGTLYLRLSPWLDERRVVGRSLAGGMVRSQREEWLCGGVMVWRT